MHAHGNTWNLLMTGKKRWILFPPNILGPRPLYWSSTGHPIDDSTLFKSYHEQFKILEFTQYAGDIVFIPQGWGHATLHMCENTVAFSREFCARTDMTSPMDVTQVMYS